MSSPSSTSSSAPDSKKRSLDEEQSESNKRPSLVEPYEFDKKSKSKYNGTAQFSIPCLNDLPLPRELLCIIDNYCELDDRFITGAAVLDNDPRVVHFFDFHRQRRIDMEEKTEEFRKLSYEEPDDYQINTNDDYDFTLIMWNGDHLAVESFLAVDIEKGYKWEFPAPVAILQVFMLGDTFGTLITCEKTRTLFWKDSKHVFGVKEITLSFTPINMYIDDKGRYILFTDTIECRYHLLTGPRHNKPFQEVATLNMNAATSFAILDDAMYGCQGNQITQWKIDYNRFEEINICAYPDLDFGPTPFIHVSGGGMMTLFIQNRITFTHWEFIMPKRSVFLIETNEKRGNGSYVFTTENPFCTSDKHIFQLPDGTLSDRYDRWITRSGAKFSQISCEGQVIFDPVHQTILVMVYRSEPHYVRLISRETKDSRQSFFECSDPNCFLPGNHSHPTATLLSVSSFC